MPGESAEEKFARERERALNQLLTLRAMVRDPRTLPGEAQAAQARIDRLESKYSITNVTARAKTAVDQKAKERAAAAEAYRREHARMKDHNGMTATDREWAMRDPVGYAAAHDQRTPKEKQRDMQNSWGQRNTWHADANRKARSAKADEPWAKKCVNPVTFFDPGGIARSRNTHRVKCDRCHVTLNIGDGCVTVLGTFCCEMTPGPRKKRPERE